MFTYFLYINRPKTIGKLFSSKKWTEKALAAILGELEKVDSESIDVNGQEVDELVPEP